MKAASFECVSGVTQKIPEIDSRILSKHRTVGPVALIQYETKIDRSLIVQPQSFQSSS